MREKSENTFVVITFHMMANRRLNSYAVLLKWNDNLAAPVDDEDIINPGYPGCLDWVTYAVSRLKMWLFSGGPMS